MEQIPRVLPWAFVFWPFFLHFVLKASKLERRPYITQKRDLSSRRDIETSAQGNALGLQCSRKCARNGQKILRMKSVVISRPPHFKETKYTNLYKSYCVTVLLCYRVTVLLCYRVTVSLCYLQTLDKFSYSNGFKLCKLRPIFLQKLFLSSALVMVCEKGNTVTL